MKDIKQLLANVFKDAVQAQTLAHKNWEDSLKAEQEARKVLEEAARSTDSVRDAMLAAALEELEKGVPSK